MKGRTFKHMQDLPREIRRMVTEKMDAADRCRYSGCSRMTFREARDTPNYLYGLELWFDEERRSIQIKLAFDEGIGIVMEFVEENDKRFLRRRAFYGRLLSCEDLDNTTNIFVYGIEYFTNHLLRHQRYIKMLAVSGIASTEQFINVQFGCQSLRRLESLSICGRDVDPQQFLSVLRQPLKKLEIFGRSNYQLSSDNEQIYGVTEYLSLPLVSLNYDQLYQLQAKTVCFNIGDMTHEDIFNFIKTWQNGGYKGNIKKCSFIVSDQTIGESLFERLGVVSRSRSTVTLKTVTGYAISRIQLSSNALVMTIGDGKPSKSRRIELQEQAKRQMEELKREATTTMNESRDERHKRRNYQQILTDSQNDEDAPIEEPAKKRSNTVGYQELRDLQNPADWVRRKFKKAYQGTMKLVEVAEF